MSRWPRRPLFVLLGPLRGYRKLGIRTWMINPGWWHPPAWHTGTPHAQRGGLSFLLCEMGRLVGKPEVETRGQVSGNWALVPNPMTGGGRHPLGDSRKFWGHPREGMRGRGRGPEALQSPAVDHPRSVGEARAAGGGGGYTQQMSRPQGPTGKEALAPEGPPQSVSVR